jgi:hypothetical protein
MAHPVERELIKVTSYKSRTKFSDRQDYLGSILNAVVKLSDDDFDNLTDEATEWANAAVHARNSKEDIPDFDEVAAEEGDEPEEADDEEAEADAEEAEDDSDDPEAADVADDTGADSDDDADSDDPDEDDEDEEDAEADDEGDADAEPEPEPKKPVRKPPAKPVKKVAEKPEPKPVKPKRHNRNPRAHEDEDVIMDKWGCMEGSKNSRALAMFEKGATTKEIKETLGGTYYNILKKMEQDGHTLEKEGAVIKLIHKDEKAKKAAPKEKAKPVAKAPAKKKK